MPLAPVAIAFAFGVGIAPWVRADVAWTTCLAALASAGALLLAGRTSRAAALLRKDELTRERLEFTLRGIIRSPS